jgi:hypothetical protein
MVMLIRLGKRTQWVGPVRPYRLTPVREAPVSVHRSVFRAVVAILLGGLAGVIGSAGPAAAAGQVGYVRLAHLSPDTPNVDVYLSAVGGGVPKVFPGVGYGVLSKYLTVPVGTYSVAMRPAGAPATDPPVLTTDVTVLPGHAYLVAGVGRHAGLGLRVIDDDLSPPASGKAKVRVIQASVAAPVLDLSIAGGAPIADGVAFATTTGYFQVPPGRWTLRAEGTNGGPASTLPVHLELGNVYSLLVLDAKSGGLTAQLRIDAARRGTVPNGGVQTGAGGSAPDPVSPWLPAGLVVAMTGAGLLAYRHRRGTRA